MPIGNQAGGGGGGGGSITSIASADGSVTVTDGTGPAVDLAVASPAATTLLFSTTLGVAGTFDQATIPQGYSDLEIVFIVRGTDAGATDNFQVRLNNDSGGNYASQNLLGNQFNTAASEVVSQTSFRAGPGIVAAGFTAGYFVPIRVWIPGYSSTVWHKTISSLPVYAFGVTTNTMISELVAGIWNSTAAVTRVQAFCASTANLAAGSQMRIYGIV